MAQQAQQLYEFGPFRLDAAKRLLWRDGEGVRLTPKCFEILLALVENSGEVIEKERLIERVWPDSFVEEGNLPYSISLLRKALSERTGEHQYIVTVPGRGYRFVALVKEIADATPPLPLEVPTATDKRRWRRGALALALLAIAILGIGYGLYRLTRHGISAVPGRNRPAPFQAMKMAPLTTAGQVADAVVSPDGKHIAYVIGEVGRQSVWVSQVATASHVQIIPPAAVEYYGLTFSRDSNYIYYVRTDKNSAMACLYQMPALGGTSKRLITDVDSRVAFSPDGKRLVFVRFSPPEKLCALMVANADGSAEQRLAVRGGSEGFLQFGVGPGWSPDGQRIACAVSNYDASGGYVNIISVRVDGSEVRPITAMRWTDVGSVTWLADGSGLVTTVTEKDLSPSQVWLIDYPSGAARRITNDLNDYRNVSLSADASAMVAVHTVHVSSLWTAVNGVAAHARRIAAGKFENDAAFAWMPDTKLAWTPDGRVVFTSNQSGNQDIWIMDADGGNQKQLTIDAGANSSPTVSPDGRYVVFSSNRAGAFNIWRMEMDGANPKRLTRGSNDRWPRCTPDGKWVFYGGMSYGKPMTSKVPIDGGDSLRLSDKFLNHPAVSPDGTLLACTYLDEAHPEWPMKIAIVSSENGEIIKLLDRTANTNSLYAWSIDGRAVMYTQTRDGVSNIWGQPITGGPPKQVTDFTSDQIFQFDWSRDGKMLLCSRGVETKDAVLIRNFR